MENLEEIRLKIKKFYILGFTLTFALAFLTGIINIYFFVIVFIFGFSSTLLSARKLNNKYKTIFKKVFVVKALESKFTDLVYDPDRGMPYQTISETNMMHMGDVYTSEDFISARYKDIKFEQADVHIQVENTSVDSDGNTTTSYVTTFMGRWMIFDFNKSFKANIQVVQKGFGNSKIKTRKSLFEKNNDTLYKKVSMESESFNQKFNVYAQNEHDAFYIITPSLMTRLERLTETNKGKLLFCFINNRLHIGIYDNKNSFEPDSIFKKINEEETIKRISDDIVVITQFVDELNLDNDLFKKEV